MNWKPLNKLTEQEYNRMLAEINGDNIVHTKLKLSLANRGSKGGVQTKKNQSELVICHLHKEIK